MLAYRKGNTTFFHDSGIDLTEIVKIFSHTAPHPLSLPSVTSLPLLNPIRLSLLSVSGGPVGGEGPGTNVLRRTVGGPQGTGRPTCKRVDPKVKGRSCRESHFTRLSWQDFGPNFDKTKGS